MSKTKVITYQAPSGDTINLTARQIKALERKGTWPKDSRGQEYCTVYRGLHYGRPIGDAEVGLA